MPQPLSPGSRRPEIISRIIELVMFGNLGENHLPPVAATHSTRLYRRDFLLWSMARCIEAEEGLSLNTFE